MNSTVVNVETPIFSRDTFASTLARQSAKVFSRLVHTPLVSMHLMNGALTGAEIDATATARVPNLEELDRQLTGLLRCLEMQSAMATRAKASDRAKESAGATLHREEQPSDAVGSPPQCAAGRQSPSWMVSAPTPLDAVCEPCCAYEGLGDEAAASGDDDHAPVKVPAESFFVQLPKFFSRAGVSRSANATERLTRGMMSAAPQPPPDASLYQGSHTNGAAVANGRNVPLGKEHVRLPRVVVEAFNIVGAIDALHHHACGHSHPQSDAYPSRQEPRGAAAPTGGKAPAHQTTLSGAASPLNATPITQGVGDATNTREALPRVPSNGQTAHGDACGERAQSLVIQIAAPSSTAALDDAALPAVLPQTDIQPCGNDGALQRARASTPAQSEDSTSRSDSSLHRASTAVPSPTEQTKEWRSNDERPADSQVPPRVVSETTFLHSSGSSASSKKEEPVLHSGSRELEKHVASQSSLPPRVPVQGGSRVVHGSPGSPSLTNGTSGAVTRGATARDSGSLPDPSYMLCNPDYADLAGWLHLLVWTRLEVIYLLRELSAVQAMTAWSAWYWAWAQDHPRQATFHFALSSTQFWRSAVRGDFRSPVALVHFSASGHMMALRSLFRLIVSCVGAAHSALESLNTVVAEIQREAEMTTSDVAAAAAAMRTAKGHHASTHGQALPASAAPGNVAAMMVYHYGGPPPPPPLSHATPRKDGTHIPGQTESAAAHGNSDAAGSRANHPFASSFLAGGGTHPSSSSGCNALLNGTSLSHFEQLGLVSGDGSPLTRQRSMAASLRPPLREAASKATANPGFASPMRSVPGASVQTLSSLPNASSDNLPQGVATQPSSPIDRKLATDTGDHKNSPDAFNPHRAAHAPWETYSNSTVGDMSTALLMGVAGGAEVGPPPCQAYDAVEALRVAVLSTITRLSSLVGTQGLPSQIAEETLAEGADWLANPFDGDTMVQDGDADAQDDLVGSDAGSRHPSQLGLDEKFTAGGIRGLTATMKAAAARNHSSTTNLASPQLRLGEFQNARKASLREGVVALRMCVGRTRFFLQSMTDLIQSVHRPPPSRHWRRATVAAVTILPAFAWVYTKSPAELLSMAKAAATRIGQIVQSYVVMPAQQLHEAIFYVRPGVEERRTSFDRDAQALANIVRDYHEDYFPQASQEELNRLRDYSLDCMRRGVADDRGFGLIEQHYRNAVKHPIRTAVFGDLPRILLIQMSFQALELSRVTNGMDEVLEGNDLNFKVMALMPVFAALSIGALWMGMKWRATMLPVRQRMKLIWRAIYRVVTLAEGEASGAGAEYGDAAAAGRGAGPAPYIRPPRHPLMSRQAQQSAYDEWRAHRRQESRWTRDRRVREAMSEMVPPPEARALRRGAHIAGSKETGRKSSDHDENDEGDAGAVNGRLDGDPVGSGTSFGSPERKWGGEAGVTNASVTTAAYDCSAEADRAHRDVTFDTNDAEGNLRRRQMRRPPELRLGGPSSTETETPNLHDHVYRRRRQGRGSYPSDGASDDSEGEEGEEVMEPFTAGRNVTARSGGHVSRGHHTYGHGRHSHHTTFYQHDRDLDESVPLGQVRFDEPAAAAGPAGGMDNLSSVRGLNNYEQGMVLVLVHLMRSLASEYFRSYVFYHELMEDLDDLESMQCSRHQRLETLRRMSHTHSFLR